MDNTDDLKPTEDLKPEHIRLLHDNVLIRQITPPGVSGHLVLPDKYKEWPPRGVVVAVGPGKLGPDGARQPVSVKPGDDVLFERRHSSELEQMRVGDSDRFLILPDEAMTIVFE